MDEISAIDGLTTSLRAVAEITKAMKDISDASMIWTKIDERDHVRSVVRTAVQSEQFDLLKICATLKKR
jgi:hypothetical protein